MRSDIIISSLLYNFIERFSVKSLGLVIGIILARLLAPDVFGIIAIITVFINLSQTIIQSGLNTALIQNKDVTENDYSTVFWVSLVLAILIILLLYFFAPLIAFCYESGTLVTPLRVYSLVLIFGSVNSIQIAILQRKMLFKKLMKCSLIATIASGFLGVLIAYLHCGIWALVIYFSSNIIFTCLLLFFITRWFPRFCFSYSRFKILFGYGWKMLISALLCTLYSDIRSLIVGKLYSPETLAFYNRGQQFPYIVSNTIDNTIQSVMFPSLSMTQTDIVSFKRMLRRSLSSGVLIISITMVFLSIVSRPLIQILFTDKWLPAVPYMQIFCIAEINIPFTSSCLIAIKAIGRSDVYMKLEFFRRLAMLFVLLISIFCFNSALSIAYGFLISAWLDIVIISIPMKKIFNYGILEQFLDTWKIFLAVFICSLFIIILGMIQHNIFVSLFIQFSIGFPLYILLCYFLRVDSFLYVLSKIQQFLL